MLVSVTLIAIRGALLVSYIYKFASTPRSSGILKSVDASISFTKSLNTFMKKYVLVVSLIIVCYSSQAQADTLLSGYDSTFYSSVLSAARGVAIPFLLRQVYLAAPGVTAGDSSLTYDGVSYHVRQEYLNPATGYYITSSQYSSYGITGFSTIWPAQFPNILFQTSDTSFDALSDCVGYLTRLLSATGDTSAYGNGYLNIINTTHAANTVPFAHRGYVATAYSFAVAFPTFPASVSAGWQYIAGNVEADTINTYNHTIVNSLSAYNGIRKGGFASSQPGDVLAFGYSASSSSNGHIMVMQTAPQLLTADSLSLFFPSQTIAQATALLATRHIYSVPVFDCSGQKAHFRDSRTDVSGIGHGTLLILTDPADDAPVGFIFDSTQVTYSTLHIDTLGASVYAISVGRFVTATTNTGIAGTTMNAPQMSIYPIPAHQLLHVSLPAGSGGQVDIYTAEGRVCYRQPVVLSSFSVDIGQWATGAYIIRYVGSDGTVQAIKWIKQ
jgi:hypothetical protein